MRESHLAILACPECKGTLEHLAVADGAEGLHCAPCSRVFAIHDDIPILLPESARSFDLEDPLLEKLEAGLEGPAAESLAKTRALVKGFEGRKSWEWEDEEYWADEYRRDTADIKPIKFPMRLWQREFLIERLLERTNLAGKTILDVGCGAGNNFRILFREHCDETTIYVAADISIDGLRLNRMRNSHSNALYVVCSANSLPFRPESVDVITYFGVLHHTERKSRTIPEDVGLLRGHGHMIVHEALVRPSAYPAFLRREIVESAHEERVDAGELAASIESVGNLEIIEKREMHTIFFGAVRKIVKRYFPKRRGAFEAAVAVDQALMRSLRSASGFFWPGEVMMLLHRRP